MGGILKVKKLWQLAKTMPTDGLFTDAEILIECAKQFFEWCDKNPLWQKQVVKHKMEWDTIDIDLKRPYTLSGLCSHLGVAQSYFRTTKKGLLDKLEDGSITEQNVQVLAAIEWIEQIILTDQLEGAMTGLYNANIVARLNGISETFSSNTAIDPVLRIVTRDSETTQNLTKLIAGL